MTRPETIPPYRILLPEGWEELAADRSGIEALMTRTSRVFREQHRPDLDAQMRTLLELAYRKLRSAGAHKIYLHTSAEHMPLPMSIVATVMTEEDGGTLDRQVTSLFQHHGAAFLRDDRTIVRWEKRLDPQRNVDDATSTIVDYLVPVPETGRKRALQLTTTIIHPEQLTEEDEAVIDQLKYLSDVLVSTFMWESAAA